MGDPHNPRRAGELWDQRRIDAHLRELKAVHNLVIVSGGWAWHFMSPPGHPEVKTHHDHKDIDVFVRPVDFDALRQRLEARGYRRVRTRHDDPSGDFCRYTLRREGESKIVFDVFIGEPPSIHICEGPRVVEPRRLLSLYAAKKHTSEKCQAVLAARDLLARGIDPVGRPELIGGKLR